MANMRYFFQAKFSEDIGIDSDRSSWFFFIIGVSSTLSRGFVGKFGKSGCISLPNIFFLGAMVLSLANFILPSTSGYTALILYCIAYGVGEGLVYTPVVNIVLDSIPSSKRGSGFGLSQMTFSCAFIVGPILSGRSAFIALITFLFIYLFIHPFDCSKVCSFIRSIRSCIR